MKSFYDKEEYSIQDIQGLIDSEAEESIYLDFKGAGALDKNDNKKREISKDISAFANSDGGIVIYGVREEDHKAHSFSFIDGDIYTKEWLEQVISSSIQRHIPDLKIFALRKDGNLQQTIYVVKIPKSIEAPHLAKDKRFYKRFNFESASMEEYEIRSLYGRRILSKLVIAGWLVNILKRQRDDARIKFLFEADIINNGDVTESDYKINVYFENFNKSLNVSWDNYKSHYDYTWINDKRLKISAAGKSPIFPDEKINGIRFNFDIPANGVLDALKDVKIEVRLYYPNGQEKMEGDLKELIDKITGTDELN
jgi:predicted HTH transcriptional regulator